MKEEIFKNKLLYYHNPNLELKYFVHQFSEYSLIIITTFFLILLNLLAIGKSYYFYGFILTIYFRILAVVELSIVIILNFKQHFMFA